MVSEVDFLVRFLEIRKKGDPLLLPKVEVSLQNKASRVLMLLLLILGIVSTTSNSIAQDESSETTLPKKYSELNLMAGTFLPYGIYGVRDNYPALWLRYGHNMGSWRIDYTFHYINAEGVTWYSAAIGAGGIVDLYESLRCAFYVGLNFHYYKPSPTNIRELDWVRSTGFHMGASPMVNISGPMYLRSDFQMNFGPGQSLFAGLGVSYLF